jgi:predicted amidohydrolase YtcJ
VVSPEDFPRFHELGVIPSMQPTHATSDMPWAEARLGPERIRGSYAWRGFLDMGLHLPLGSDFPVEEVSPLVGIHAAVTRQDHEGRPEGGWFPEQRLTLLEAVRGFTLHAAYAAFEEEERGSIEVGKRGDFTILDRDIFARPPADLLLARVLYTILDGEIVYARE